MMRTEIEDEVMKGWSWTDPSTPLQGYPVEGSCFRVMEFVAYQYQGTMGQLHGMETRLRREFGDVEFSAPFNLFNGEYAVRARRPIG